MIGGIPNRPLYFYQKDIIGDNRNISIVRSMLKYDYCHDKYANTL